MNNWLRILTAILCFCGATVLHAAPKMKLEANEANREVLRFNGMPAIASDVINDDGSGTRVILAPVEPEYRRKQRLTFSFTVYNYTEGSLTVSPENLTATNSDNESLDMLSAESQRSKLRRDASEELMERMVQAELLDLLGVQGPERPAGFIELDVAEFYEASLAARLQGQRYFDGATLGPGERSKGIVVMHPPNKRARDDTITWTIVVGKHTHRIVFDFLRIE